MSYGNFRKLPRGTTSDNILNHRAFDVARNPKNDGYQPGLSSIAFKVF